MFSFTVRCLAALSIASIVSTSPCPHGELAERGELSEEDAAKFYAARSEGPAAVESMIHENQKREFAAQEQYHKRQLDPGELLLGGGLLNGLLQPYTGILAALDGMYTSFLIVANTFWQTLVPVPQEFSLQEIPGDDADHQYQSPGKIDVRGMCPTLNTMANNGYISRDGITTFAEAANACQITVSLPLAKTQNQR
jgi:hypothetical protein